MNPIGVLHGAGSIARTGYLLDRGVTKRELAAAVNAGEVLRLRKGVVALPNVPAEFAAAVTTNSLITCATAAAHYQLWLLNEPETHHLSCPGSSCGTYINHHRDRTVPVHASRPMVGLVDVLIHALHCLPPVEAAVIVESSLRRGDTIRPFLLDRLQGNRNGKARAALDLVTGCAESPLEVVARILFKAAGFHVETQVSISGVGRVDFLLEGFLVVEVDGDKFHSDRKTRRRDRIRNNMTIIGGYTVLRYGYAEIMHNPSMVISEIRQVLSGRVVR